MNIVKACFQVMNCLAGGLHYFFQRTVECCFFGKPKAKQTSIIHNPMPSEKLKTLQERKVIYLLPENHFFPSNQDVQFKKEILFKAIPAKKLIYGMEGLERNGFAEQELRITLGLTKEAALYGIENSFYHIFNTACDLNIKLKDKSNDLDEVIRDDKKNLLAALVNQGNQTYLDNFWKSTVLQKNALFRYLKTEKKSLSSMPLQAQMQIFGKIEVAKPIWLEFTKQAALILVPDLKNILSKDQQKQLALNYLEDNFEIKSIDQLLTICEHLHLNIREDFIAENFVSIYELTKNQNNPFASHLGEKHITGIKSRLEKQGFTILGKKELEDILQI